MTEKNAVIRLGAYYLIIPAEGSGYGWGPKKIADKFTMEEALKLAAKLRKVGYNCKAAWIEIPTRRERNIRR